MDLGIAGKKALVCASSRGLGLACATALAREGCDVAINGRDRDALESAAAQIEAVAGRRPRIVVADLNTEEGRASLIEACPEPDILINNNAGPAPGKIADWSREDWLGAVEANMLAPIFLIKAVRAGHARAALRPHRQHHVRDGQVAERDDGAVRRRARGAHRAQRSRLQRDGVVDNVTINNMLPERFDTDRQRYMAERMVKKEGITRRGGAAADRRDDRREAPRRPEEFGDACAFLCSAQAGFISGQNLQLDGGSYAGLV